MISISTIVANTSGNVVINEKSTSDVGAKKARVTRTATLDGGVYLNHSGYAEGDRTLRIKSRVTTSQVVALSNIFENFTSSLLAFKEGIFLGAISTLSSNNGELTMTFLIQQKEF